MSTRRIDDPGSFDGDAIGALVAQLPGATRLSHVLTAGAKHLEAQQLQQRKSADVAGYARSKYPAYDQTDQRTYNYTPGPFNVGNNNLDVLLYNYQRELNTLLRAGPRADGYAENVLQALEKIKHEVRTVNDLDYLREKDAYVALAYIFNHNLAMRNDAKALLREALHSDQFNAAAEKLNVVKLIRKAKTYIGGSDVVAVNPDNAKWAKLDDDELAQLDKLIRNDPTPPTAEEVERMKRVREEEDKEAMKANMKWAADTLERQAEKRAARGDSGTSSVDYDPDTKDPEQQPQWQW